jgi:hypothetical protein
MPPLEEALEEIRRLRTLVEQSAESGNGADVPGHMRRIDSLAAAYPESEEITFEYAWAMGTAAVVEGQAGDWEALRQRTQDMLSLAKPFAESERVPAMCAWGITNAVRAWGAAGEVRDMSHALGLIEEMARQYIDCALMCEYARALEFGTLTWGRFGRIPEMTATLTRLAQVYGGIRAMPQRGLAVIYERDQYLPAVALAYSGAVVNAAAAFFNAQLWEELDLLVSRFEPQVFKHQDVTIARNFSWSLASAISGSLSAGRWEEAEDGLSRLDRVMRQFVYSERPLPAMLPDDGHPAAALRKDIEARLNAMELLARAHADYVQVRAALLEELEQMDLPGQFARACQHVDELEALARQHPEYRQRVGDMDDDFAQEWQNAINRGSFRLGQLAAQPDDEGEIVRTYLTCLFAAAVAGVRAQQLSMLVRTVSRMEDATMP